MPAKPFRLGYSLEKLHSQINARFPHCDTASDGWIGDPAHQAVDSDHNPHIKEITANVVSAIDIINERVHGCEANKIAKSLAAKREPRIKYVISN